MAHLSRALRSLPLASSLQFRQPQLARVFHSSPIPHQEQQLSDPKAHRNFYKSHGRALFKALTMAFFSYQVSYWAWITIETEEMKDQRDYEIKSLEGEVRLLEEGRKSHRPTATTDST